ncbi:MAG: hypothetical protein JXR31_06730, partial [Prolixibacteraceae bacterium]|nr:hypothetical protein [Prolixibacteraceae bacterium]
MAKETASAKKKKRGLKNVIPLLIIIMVIIGVPLLLLNYQAKRSGLTTGEVIQRIFKKSDQGTSVSSGDNKLG